MDIKDSFNNINNSKVSVHLPKHKTPTQLTSKLGKYTIIGRAEELQKIDTLLKESNSSLLINGIGGIGKSTIASYYLHSQKENLDYYGFFEGLESFTSELREPLALKQERENDAFLEALSKLRNLKGNKLLVFDDIKEIEENKDKIEKILALKDSGYKILLTSRMKINEIKTYVLSVLTLDDAKKLFLKYYQTDDIDRVEKIIKYLDYHALFIELLSKVIDNEGYSLEEIIGKFERGELSKIEFINEEDGDETSFNKNLKELFEIQKKSLNEEYIVFLKQLSVLPSIDIEFSLLADIFWKEKLKGKLNFLVNKGWLSGDGKSYKLHQIIKEFLLYNHPPIVEDIEIVIKYFVNKIENDYTIEESLKRYDDLLYLESFASIPTLHNNKGVEYLIHSAGHLNYLVGNYKKAQKFHKLSFEISKEILDEDDIHFAIRLNGQAKMLEHDGKYHEALEIYLKSLKIREKYFFIYPEKVAIEYNNIGRMYKKIGNYDESYIYLNISLNMRKEIFGEKNEYTARAYNVLGQFLLDVVKRTLDKKEQEETYGKAYEYSFKALEIRVKVLSEYHPDLAISLMNMGLFHTDMREYDEAMQYFQCSLAIFEKAIGDYSNYIALIYFNKGTMCWEQEKFEEAITCKEKSLQLWSKILVNNHPNLISNKKEIAMMK